MSYAAPYQFAQPFAVYPQTGYAMNNFGAGANPYGYAYANTPYYGYGGSAPTQVVPYTIASNGMPYYSPYYNPYTRNPHRAFGGLRSAFARKIFGPKPWRRVHWAPGRQYRHDGGRFGAAWGNIYGARPGTPMPNAVYPQIALPGNYQVPYGGYGSFPVTNVITIPSAYSNVSEEVYDDDDSDGSSEYSDEY